MRANTIKPLFPSAHTTGNGFAPFVLQPHKALSFTRKLDSEILEGRNEGRARKGSGGSQSLSSKLQKRVGKSSALAKRALSRGAGKAGFDTRQRAVVQLHYFSHSAGGSASLREHARYVARDAAARDPVLEAQRAEPETGRDLEGGRATPEPNARAHARYLSRELTGAGERSVFYHALHEGVDGRAAAAHWARNDHRHFRITLSAENGSRLGDLKDYARDVMARAEAALGTKLEWIAVDHWDTDNPHTHIILRGTRDNGRALFIPREYVQHGFRSAARDAATERLGQRTRADERLALSREVRAHRPTRLDKLIADQLPADRIVRLADLRVPAGSPELNDALTGRAQELRRLGLAVEVKRNVLRFELGWRDALKAMELHLDIRKALMQARAQDAARVLAAKGLPLTPGRDL